METDSVRGKQRICASALRLMGATELSGAEGKSQLFRGAWAAKEEYLDGWCQGKHHSAHFWRSNLFLVSAQFKKICSIGFQSISILLPSGRLCGTYRVWGVK